MPQARGMDRDSNCHFQVPARGLGRGAPRQLQVGPRPRSVSSAAHTLASCIVANSFRVAYILIGRLKRNEVDKMPRVQKKG